VNRAALLAAVSDWSARNDLSAPLLTSFLSLAEQRIFIGSAEVEPVRHYRMLTTTTLTPSGSSAPLPSDFLDAERATVTEGGRVVEVEYRSPARMAQHEGQASPARFFRLQGSSLVFAPTPAGSVELLYYARPATPVADADENWIMRDASGVYLFAMLVEVGLYLRDEALVAEHSARYVAAAGALQRAGDRTQSGSMSSLRITTQ
jgi:hypothetical protein